MRKRQRHSLRKSATQNLLSGYQLGDQPKQSSEEDIYEFPASSPPKRLSFERRDSYTSIISLSENSPTSKMERQIDELESEAETKQSESEDIIEMCELLKSQNKKLSESVVYLKDQLNETNSEVKTMESTCRKIESEVETLGEKNRVLKNDVLSDLNEKLRGLEKEKRETKIFKNKCQEVMVENDRQRKKQKDLKEQDRSITLRMVRNKSPLLRVSSSPARVGCSSREGGDQSMSHIREPVPQAVQRLRCRSRSKRKSSPNAVPKRLLNKRFGRPKMERQMSTVNLKINQAKNTFEKLEIQHRKAVRENKAALANLSVEMEWFEESLAESAYRIKERVGHVKDAKVYLLNETQGIDQCVARRMASLRERIEEFVVFTLNYESLYSETSKSAVEMGIKAFVGKQLREMKMNTFRRRIKQNLKCLDNIFNPKCF